MSKYVRKEIYVRLIILGNVDRLTDILVKKPAGYLLLLLFYFFKNLNIKHIGIDNLGGMRVVNFQYGK